MTHNATSHYRPTSDLAKERKALDLTLDLLATPTIADALGNPTVRETTDAAEQILFGDLCLEWEDGARQYLEVKTVSHSMIPVGADVSLYAGKAHEARFPETPAYPTTICELVKANTSGAAHTLTVMSDLAGILHLGEATLRALPVTNSDNFATVGDIEAGHHNFNPFRFGAVAVYVDIVERSINLHSAEELLGAVREQMLKGRIYDSPGGCDAGTLLVRGLPYGPMRLAQAAAGGWLLVGDEAAREATRGFFARRLGAVSLRKAA